MAKLTPADIRNVALVGHNSSGKTTLADSMLFKSGAVTRRGQIADGTSVFDFADEEREKRVTIDLAVATAPYKNAIINVFDTPGYHDFCGEAICALNVAEIAAVCVSASDGIMVNTRKMWTEAGRVGNTRAILINKCDADNVDLPKLIGAIREKFGPECVPVQLPNATGAALQSVFSVLTPPADLPAGLADLVTEAKEKLMEVDDALLEKYLEGAAVSDEELQRALPGALAEGKVVPIVCLSADKDIGVAELMDFIVTYLPSPAARWSGREGDAWKAAGKDDAPFAGQVFKSFADKHVGRLAYVKVIQGVIKPDTPLKNVRTDESSRIGGLFKPFGKEQKPVTEAIPGDVCCVSKVEGLIASDTVGGAAKVEPYPAMAFPNPMVSLAVSPKSKQDEQRLSTALTKMSDSDPTFRITRDQQSGELVVTAMSQMHLDVTIHRLKSKFDVEVTSKPPKIPYKETISKAVDGHHKHKKQSGGRGQFAEVYIRLEPNTRDAGYEFVDEIKQGRVPREFIPSVDKGMQEACAKGVVASCPVVDVKVKLVDGKHHEVDSDNRSFQIAGSKAFKTAFQAARPVLLEPIVNIEIVVPAKYMGDITGDLNSRRGRIQGMDTDGDNQVITAQIPLMEIQNYSTELRSMTGGEGWYSFTPSHYDILPSHVAAGVIAQYKAKEEEEE